MRLHLALELYFSFCLMVLRVMWMLEVSDFFILGSIEVAGIAIYL